jgi:hypothetical protein
MARGDFKTKRKAGPGRPPGLKNKVPTEIKAHFLYVFETLQKNPKTSLLTTAREKPDWFYELSKALLPKEIKADITASQPLLEVVRQVLQGKQSTIPAATSPRVPQPGGGSCTVTGPSPSEGE